jgi:hypothetical protein
MRYKQLHGKTIVIGGPAEKRDLNQPLDTPARIEACLRFGELSVARKLKTGAIKPLSGASGWYIPLISKAIRRIALNTGRLRFYYLGREVIPDLILDLS